MKVIAIILFVAQAISLSGSFMNGQIAQILEDLMFMNGLYGYSRLMGYFLPSIIGAILWNRSNKKKDNDADASTVVSKADSAPSVSPQPAVKHETVKVEYKQPDVELHCTMTSQLVYLWMQTKNIVYLEEYKRRLKICGLTQEAIQRTLEFDMEIFRKYPRPEMLDSKFVTKPLLTLKKCFLPRDVSYYQTNFDYPLSYVIRISDEADYHFWNSHEKDLPSDVWSEIFKLSDKGGKSLFIPLAMYLTTDLGWTVQNVNKFSYNEQGMLDKYRWNKSITAAAKNPWQ